MSHFVSSSKGDRNRNFQDLEEQLLRREPVHHEEDQAASDDIDAQTGASTGNPSVPSSSAQSRASTPTKNRPLSLSRARSPLATAANTRSPSYSRTNSPERRNTRTSGSHDSEQDDDHDQRQPTGREQRYHNHHHNHRHHHHHHHHHGRQQQQRKQTITPATNATTPTVYDPLLPPTSSTSIVQHQRPSKQHSHTSGLGVPPRKLGTWDGVFVPVTLNILGVILFLRFGFIMGQAGLVGSIALLLISYTIDALTTMSISAIATNGVVRAGGIFYLASRSLGPEFGGATGLLFWLGQALNASLNALGFVETLTDAFGQSREAEEHGPWGIPEGAWWSFAYGSFVLLASTIVCLVGSKVFIKATMVLAVILALSILSIPVSSLIKSPYIDEEVGIYYTSWSLETLKSNLFPHFTSGAAGAASPAEKQDWASVFGVLFPAVTGILAGASMSGDLRKPSKSIPKGTNWSLLLTFTVYLSTFLVLAGTTSRISFYKDISIISDISILPSIITLGALSSTLFSSLMSIQASGKILQAIARDHLLFFLDFLSQGTEQDDIPTFGIVVTYIVCQAVLFADSVNVIAKFVTMTSLLCFAVLSFACLALKAGGAPSFRPSFPYFNIYTAASGAALSIGAMFFTDSTAAAACTLLAIVLFAAIHILSPPKPWGDVTRNVHYWLTRKYLLRLDERKTNLKHWRPQVLLLANNPRSEWNLIIFCNSLKKGGLYVLGHCIKGEFAQCLAELRKQQIAWLKLVDLSGIKSFVDVVIANDEREGARSLILSAGLGGMRPNIVVMGFPRDLQMHVRANIASLNHPKRSNTTKSDESEITIRGPHAAKTTGTGPDLEHLPTDATRRESPITAAAYVGIIEDALALNKAVAVAYGFDMMQLPGPSSTVRYQTTKEKQYIDLWPIQIASPDSDPEHAWDTYTMVLQLGTILSLTGTWKSHQLRVSVFVEDASEVEQERKRVRSLLDNLRIPASLRVFCLSDGSVLTYETIVKGRSSVPPFIEEALRRDPWWNALKDLRRRDEIRAKEAASAAAAKQRAKQAHPTDINANSAGASSPSSSLSGQRSKREQKLLGYSLPPEHMEYFQRNIRIGLSHPRAKPRTDDTDVEDDDDESDSDSDGSGLSDELLRLGQDDFFGAGVGSSNITRRARSYSQGNRQGSTNVNRQLPDEPVRRRRMTQDTTPIGSYGSLSSTPIVKEDGRVVMRRERDLSRDSTDGEDGEGTLKASDRNRFVLKTSNNNNNNNRSASSASDAEDEGTTSTSDKPQRHSRWYSDHHQENSHSHPGPSTSTTPLAPNLTFNTLPDKAQFLILNELFRSHSSSAETSVILTSLPAPEYQCSASHDKIARYLSQLEVLCAGSTPVLGIHARELTLSMSL
ncbi:unnamed protein product [Sympodiomycopsis kandeliae]